MPIRYLAVTGRHGPAAARNAGWRAARGRDHRLHRRRLHPRPALARRGASPPSRTGVAAVAGRVVVPLPERPTDYERDAAGLERAEFVTANCFCRRDVLEAVGGFDERFAAAWREDSDLHFALLRAGLPDRPGRRRGRRPPGPAGPLGRQPPAAAQEPVRRAALQEHPELYRRQIRPSPPWDYYAIVGARCGRGSRPALGSARGRRWPPPALWAAAHGPVLRRRLRRTSLAPRHVAEMVVTSALIPPLSVFWRLYGALKFRVLFL